MQILEYHGRSDFSVPHMPRDTYKESGCHRQSRGWVDRKGKAFHDRAHNGRNKPWEKWTYLEECGCFIELRRIPTSVTENCVQLFGFIASGSLKS